MVSERRRSALRAARWTRETPCSWSHLGSPRRRVCCWAGRAGLGPRDLFLPWYRASVDHGGIVRSDSTFRCTRPLHDLARARELPAPVSHGGHQAHSLRLRLHRRGRHVPPGAALSPQGRSAARRGVRLPLLPDGALERRGVGSMRRDIRDVPGLLADGGAPATPARQRALLLRGVRLQDEPDFSSRRSRWRSWRRVTRWSISRSRPPSASSRPSRPCSSAGPSRTCCTASTRVEFAEASTLTMNAASIDPVVPQTSAPATCAPMRARLRCGSLRPLLRRTSSFAVFPAALVAPGPC